MKLVVCALAFVALTQATEDIEWPKYSDKYYKLPNQRIAGGIEAVPNSIPYQVDIVRTTTDGNFVCGGSLISAKYVLTAAGCIYNAISVRVTLGAHHRNEVEDTQVRLTTTKFVLHPGYILGDAHLHNIAVIELPEEVELNDYIKPVDLPTWADAANDYAGFFARISGWGRVSVDGPANPVLYYVFADIITNSECYRTFSDISISHICTNGNGGVGMCGGDNGGPLIADGKQVGIGSLSSGCGSGNPSVFTRVTYYLDWIAQNTDVVIKQ